MRYEVVFIGADAPGEDVLADVARALGDREVQRNSSGELFVEISDTAAAWLDEDDFGDDIYATFDYELVIRELGFEDLATDYDVQEATARRVYDALVAGTPWRLALAFDDGGDIVAIRPALTTA